MEGEYGQIQEQVTRIEEAMKASGLWTVQIPEWVSRYNGHGIPDIWQWLQFVYLPLCREGKYRHREYLAPVLSRHLGPQAIAEYDHVIRRIIELDAITPVRIS